MEADGLSARAANSPEVRRKLRTRARYEAANNSYLAGMVRTLANDLIGPGPRLQMLTTDRVLNRTIETAVCGWMCECGLAEKLRTMRGSLAIDGEAFAFLTSDPSYEDVELDVRLYEADQVATPFPAPLDPLAVDGIELDARGKPARYHLLRVHPGDLIYFGMPYLYDSYPASQVRHWFRADRPQQYRGVPDVTPALGLFAQLRRYTLAVLAAAETAADFAAVLQSQLPPDADPIQGTPFESIPIEHRMMTTLPAGYTIGQFKAEQPATTYEMFKRELLNEIARSLNLPYNVAAGNSSGYNYSSGRLDHQTYYRLLAVERSHLERAVLDPVLDAWLEEAAMATDYVPAGLAVSRLPHRWLWPGIEHVDPEKEARAQATRLGSFMTTFSEECARDGIDRDVRLAEIARDIADFAAAGIPRDPYSPAPTAAAAPAPEPPTPPDGANDNVDSPADQGGNADGHARQALVHRNGHARR